MIGLRWRRAEFHPNSLEAEPNSVMAKDYPVVLQYREAWSEILVNSETSAKMRCQSFDGVEWQDVPIDD